ncbi:ECF transporter S component [uncultured Eubacterium sp.]|uniref:ECF transporter S component n=1 Tax=uncultured Eubacterium sp. TaxID=165185 RepID=UPI002601FF23|nr:ECF transporter S component [uncultured Eubacterium sp.]
MNSKVVSKIVLTALFAALVYVATSIIRYPTFGTQGYINIGDTIVLLSAWLIGGVYGALAAGIGSALADLLAQYVTYVPGTFIIKFLMALVAYLIFTAFKKTNINKVVAYIVSGVVAELIMVFGYFLYESTILGYGLAAADSIPSNAIQAGTCLVIGYIAIGVLEGAKVPNLLKKYV